MLSRRLELKRDQIMVLIAKDFKLKYNSTAVIILSSLQLINFFATGNPLDPLTLLNFGTALALPFAFVLKLNLFFVLYLMCYVELIIGTNFLFDHVETKN